MDKVSKHFMTMWEAQRTATKKKKKVAAAASSTHHKSNRDLLLMLYTIQCCESSVHVCVTIKTATPQSTHCVLSLAKKNEKIAIAAEHFLLSTSSSSLLLLLVASRHWFDDWNSIRFHLISFCLFVCLFILVESSEYSAGLCVTQTKGWIFPHFYSFELKHLVFGRANFFFSCIFSLLCHYIALRCVYCLMAMLIVSISCFSKLHLRFSTNGPHKTFTHTHTQMHFPTGAVY